TAAAAAGTARTASAAGTAGSTSTARTAGSTSTAGTTRTASTAAAARSTAAAPTASATIAPVTSTAPFAVVARGSGRGHVGEVRAGVALGHDFALVDPALHADAPEGGAGLVEAVVDVRAHGVQWHPSVRVAFRAGHLGTAEAPGDLDLHALGARAHGAGQGALHRAAEGHPVLQLLGDRLGHELGVELRALDLEDVDLDLLFGHAVQVAAQRVHFGARLADHDARARRVDVDLELLGVLADRDVRQPRVGELVDDVLAHAHVLGEVLGEVALVEPVGLPVVDVSHAHGLWMNLLSHFSVSQPCRLVVPGSGRGVNVMVRWLVRLRIGVARPIARGLKRLIVGPSSAYASRTIRSSSSSSWLLSAFATADSSSLLQSRATSRGVKARIARASCTDLPRMCPHTMRALRAWAATTRRRGALAASFFARLGLAAGSAAFSATGSLVSAAFSAGAFFAAGAFLAAAFLAGAFSPSAFSAVASAVGSLALAAFAAFLRAGFLAALAALASAASAPSSGSTGVCSSGVIAPCPTQRARGMCGWERTRRACARPSTR